MGEDGREAIEVVRGIVKMPAILRTDRERNLSLGGKAIPKEFICFSFSTGFLFWKKEKVLGCMRFIQMIIMIFRGI